MRERLQGQDGRVESQGEAAERDGAKDNHALTSSPRCRPPAGDLHWGSTDGRKPEGGSVCRWGPRATPISLPGTQQSGERPGRGAGPTGGSSPAPCLWHAAGF